MAPALEVGDYIAISTAAYGFSEPKREDVAGVTKLIVSDSISSISCAISCTQVPIGVGFSLVPWKPVIEQRIGQTMTAVIRGNGVSWELGRQRGASVM
jgi:signal peptidase I